MDNLKVENDMKYFPKNCFYWTEQDFKNGHDLKLYD